MPKSVRLPLAAAALAALVLAHPVRPARAGDVTPSPEEGPKTVVKYAACAGGLAFASDLASAYAAILYCVKTFLDEFSP